MVIRNDETKDESNRRRRKDENVGKWERNGICNISPKKKLHISFVDFYLLPFFFQEKKIGYYVFANGVALENDHWI